MKLHPVDSAIGLNRVLLAFWDRRHGQVAQLVEQGTENPRVGGSSPSLATFLRRAIAMLLVFIWATGCKPDPCEQLCDRVANRLSECMQDWPIGWDDLDATSKANFRKRCNNRWDEVRSRLEPRELEDAREQCSETSQALTRLRAENEVCDQLRAVYVE
jgi:hypothetical protein